MEKGFYPRRPRTTAARFPSSYNSNPHGSQITVEGKAAQSKFHPTQLEVLTQGCTKMQKEYPVERSCDKRINRREVNSAREGDGRREDINFEILVC